MRGPLSHAQCDEVKQAVADMLEECDIHTWPIDCFEIARKLHYVLRPYSVLPFEKRLWAYMTDKDGFSRVEMNPISGMFEYVIYYEDTAGNEGRMRWTIFHEIGHCCLGHHDHPDDSLTDIEEAEAELFAKYAIAPLPLVRRLRLQGPQQIQEVFNTSHSASCYIWEYYGKRLQYGPIMMEAFEKQIIRLFEIA